MGIHLCQLQQPVTVMLQQFRSIYLSFFLTIPKFSVIELDELRYEWLLDVAHCCI